MGRKFAAAVAQWRRVRRLARLREFRRNRAACLSCRDLYGYPSAIRDGSGVSGVEVLIDLVFDFTRRADQDP